MRKQLLTLTLLASLTGCSDFPGVYKMPVPQGNPVSQEQLNQLRPGMTQSQVRYVMGTPLVEDTFHENRWDYVYHLVEEDEMTANNRVQLYFENGRLARIGGDMRPGAEPVAEPAVPETRAETPEAAPPQ